MDSKESYLEAAAELSSAIDELAHAIGQVFVPSFEMMAEALAQYLDYPFIPMIRARWIYLILTAVMMLIVILVGI